MNFYLCDESSNDVIIAGDLYDILENGEAMKLSGHICTEDVSIGGESIPGQMIGVLDSGRSYWIPMVGNTAEC